MIYSFPKISLRDVKHLIRTHLVATSATPTKYFVTYKFDCP